MKLFFDEETKQWTINVSGHYSIVVLASYIKSAVSSRDGLLYKSKPLMYIFDGEMRIGQIVFFSTDQSVILEAAMYMARKVNLELEIG